MDKKTRVNRWLNDSSCVTEILDNTTSRLEDKTRQTHQKPGKIPLHCCVKFLIGNLGLKHFEFLCVWLLAFCVVALRLFLLFLGQHFHGIVVII